MKEEYIKWYSPTLNMDTEMLVFGHSGYPVIVFPTSRGRYFETKDFGLIESARWFVENGLVKIFCPDGIDGLSFYNKNVSPYDRIRNQNWYDEFIKNEVIEKVRHESPNGKVVLAGCSFGGYHALNTGCRHAHLVSHIFSMSGAYDIRSFMDGYYDDQVYFHNPVDYLANDNNPNLWNLNIVLGTADWDICLDDNVKMSEMLYAKGIDHWLDIRKWAKHDWPLWKMVFPHYLSNLVNNH